MRKRKKLVFALLLSGVLCLGGCAAAKGEPDTSGETGTETQESAVKGAADEADEGAKAAADKQGGGAGSAGGEPGAQEARGLFEEFEAADLEGNAVTQDLFAEHDLTMINIWATFCGPCISEMPELGVLSEEYKDQGVQIVGLCIDAAGVDGAVNESQLEEAKRIVEETGASYLHIIPGETLATSLMMQVQAVPTTIFVDKEGKQVGMGVMGARDKDAWSAMIQELLDSVRTVQAD